MTNVIEVSNGFAFNEEEKGLSVRELTPLTAYEIIAFLMLHITPVAWAVGRDNKISGLSAIYQHKISAERHIDSYKNYPDFNNVTMEIIELYQLPKEDL